MRYADGGDLARRQLAQRHRIGYRRQRHTAGSLSPHDAGPLPMAGGLRRAGAAAIIHRDSHQN
jgi:hypothetical protein